MERVSILSEGPAVELCDLPQKILDAVGDIVSLPELAAVPEEEFADSPGAMAHPLPAAEAQVPPFAEESAGPRFGFVWPTLDDLSQKGMDLKEFLDTVEERLLGEALQKADGVKNQAAEILGIKRTTLIEKLKKRNME
ncbi:MAG: hypothetical protein DELT_01610 [Desulfovibrio sp.]